MNTILLDTTVLEELDAVTQLASDRTLKEPLYGTNSAVRTLGR